MPANQGCQDAGDGDINLALVCLDDLGGVVEKVEYEQLKLTTLLNLFFLTQPLPYSHDFMSQPVALCSLVITSALGRSADGMCLC